MRRERPLDGIPDQLWRMVMLARHRLLMLDYDGTLAPFKVMREQAVPLPESLALLRRIAGSAHTSVAIVSGRPLTEVEQLVGDIPAVFVGEHGWELRAADGSIVQRPLEHSVASTIDEAERIARKSGWGDLLERKRSAIVLHTRGLPEPQARKLREGCAAAWRELVPAGRAVLDQIEGGVELRARGRNKGTAVLSLLSQSPPGTLGVFVGDDVTDEDAFDVVRDWGFGVRVGDMQRASLAMGRLPSCEVVPLFLERWIAITSDSVSSTPQRSGGR